MRSIVRALLIAGGAYVFIIGIVVTYCALIGQLVAVTRAELSRNTSLGIVGLVVIMAGYLIVRNCIEDDLRDDE